MRYSRPADTRTGHWDRHGNMLKQNITKVFKRVALFRRPGVKRDTPWLTQAACSGQERLGGSHRDARDDGEVAGDVDEE